MRIEGVILENHRNIAVFRVDVIDHLLTDENFSLAHIFQTCDHAQAGTLATAGRADQYEKLLIHDIKIDILDNLNVTEALVDMLK